jgi:GT2 family glycosyltransferase
MVPEALDSVFAQTYLNFEVVAVDDGSTDDTKRVIKQRYGDRLTYIYQENQGPASARNASVRAARGEYIALMDDDDLWLPTKLEKQMAALEEHPECALAYCACLEATADGQSTGKIHKSTNEGRTGDNFALFLRRAVIMETSVVVRRSAFEEVGLFDEQLPTAKDTDLFLRLALHHPAVYLREPLMLVREHPGRKSHSDRQRGKHFQARVRIMQKLLAMLPPEKERHRPLLARTLLSARCQLLLLRAEQLEWDAFESELLDIIRSAAALPGDHAFGQSAGGAIRSWEQAHAARSAERLPTAAEIVELAEALAAAGEGPGARSSARAASIYAALGLHRLRDRRLRSGLSWLARGARQNLGATLRHCAWALSEAEG